jgi:hypothetical protein
MNNKTESQYPNPSINRAKLLRYKPHKPPRPLSTLWNKLIRLGINRYPKIIKKRNAKYTQPQKRSKKTPKTKRIAAKQNPSLPALLLTNAQSICNKIEDANQLLDDANPDIAFITETWLTEQNKSIKLNQLHPNYLITSTERANKKGGGTLILVKESFSKSVKPIPIPEYTPPPWLAESKEVSKVEITMVKIKPKRMPREFSSILAICVYIPEFTASKHASAIYQLSQVIEQAITNSTQNNQPLIYIVGDLNGADVGPIKRTYNLYQINKAPTRENKTLGRNRPSHRRFQQSQGN